MLTEITIVTFGLIIPLNSKVDQWEHYSSEEAKFSKRNTEHRILQIVE